MRSEKTFPAPTEGSWSGSPTRIRRQPGFNARSKDIINCKSTIDVSSTNHCINVQGFFFVVVKGHHPRCFVKLRLQKPVNGRRFASCDLAEPF